MGLYFRKSVSVGPFRFNLSKGGVGVSVGVPGFRVGTSPRGNYIHVGRAGLYYRATVPGRQSTAVPTKLTTSASAAEVVMHEIDSAEASTIVDTDSAELVAEMHAKSRRLRLWPWVFALGVGGYAGIVHRWPNISALVTIGFAVFAVVATLGAMLFDRVRKTTVLMYDFEPGAERSFEQLHAAFDALESSGRRWHISAQGQVHDRKYHAGASRLVNRTAITVGKRSPPFVKTNIDVPFVPVGKQTLYFFPDVLLIFEPEGVGAVSYSKLSVNNIDSRFIEEEGVPRDAKVVDRTWRYVNKSGGPDRRFKDNRELPIALYGRITLESDSGLNEVIQVSRLGVAERIVGALKELDRVNRARSKGRA
ncbi:DUF4236 domain-containing protein [Steroidobacter cummioxidans]|uniref:DUF4236 domain-containing protein n=1 Tax=Steroidobacter cummioxidans TaxID=1803913 RepID=UPI000E317096|nr:DUF4236 domain-containing protein [Steroidobacter cummioxidans]